MTSEPFQIRSKLYKLQLQAATDRLGAHMRDVIEAAEDGRQCVCETCDAVMVPLISRGPSWFDKDKEWYRAILCRECGAQLVDEVRLSGFNLGRWGG